jgi:hypothetical protein
VEDWSGHLIVEATINDSRKVRFLLDTGAGANLISTALAAELGLTVEGELPAKGVAGYTTVGLATIDELAVGEVTLLDQSVTAIDFERALPDLLGSLDGILGYEFFRHFVVTIDYQSAQMMIYDSEVAPPRSGIGLQVSFLMRAPLVEGGANGTLGSFVIDLGNNRGILAHKYFTDIARLDTLAQHNNSSGSSLGGVGGRLGLRDVMVPQFNLGELNLTDVSVSLLESAEGLSASKHVAGNIGASFLRDYKVTLDYPNQRIWLEALD